MPTHRSHATNHLTSRGHINHEVVDLYRQANEPFVETTIVLRTPLAGTPLESAMLSHPDNIATYLDGLNQKVQEDLGKTFECDVLRISSQLHHYLRLGDRTTAHKTPPKPGASS